jgi:hypothetical protein
MRVFNRIEAIRRAGRLLIVPIEGNRDDRQHSGQPRATPELLHVGRRIIDGPEPLRTSIKEAYILNDTSGGENDRRTRAEIGETCVGT